MQPAEIVKKIQYHSKAIEVLNDQLSEHLRESSSRQQYFNKTQAAEYIGCSRRHIYNLIHEGSLVEGPRGRIAKAQLDRLA